MKTIKNLFKIGLRKEKQKKIEKIRVQLLKAIAQKNETKIACLFANLSEKNRKLILNPKVDYRTTSYMEDPLHFAIRNRLENSVELFIPYITNINRQPYAVGTALHFACQQGMKNVVRLLLERSDINLNAKNHHYGTSFGGDNSHATPLNLLVDYIVKFGDVDNARIDIIKLLLKDKRINTKAASQLVI